MLSYECNECLDMYLHMVGCIPVSQEEPALNSCWATARNVPFNAILTSNRTTVVLFVAKFLYVPSIPRVLRNERLLEHDCAVRILFFRTSFAPILHTATTPLPYVKKSR